MYYRRSNSNVHAYQVNTLSTEPLPQCVQAFLHGIHKNALSMCFTSLSSPQSLELLHIRGSIPKSSLKLTSRTSERRAGKYSVARLPKARHVAKGLTNTISVHSTLQKSGKS